MQNCLQANCPGSRVLKLSRFEPTGLAHLVCHVGSLLSNSQATSLIWSAHTVSLACCDHPHRSFCQFRRTIWTLLLVVSLLLLRDFGTLFHWTVKLRHPLTHLRSVLRHFSLIRHNHTVARASVLWRDINWLIDWLMSGVPCWKSTISKIISEVSATA